MILPVDIKHYHVFLASPGDMANERTSVRRFFERYNRTTARRWGVSFDVIDWENYADAGVGRPQELITAQTLERFRDSLALVIGLMGQRFGTPSTEAESGDRGGVRLGSGHPSADGISGDQMVLSPDR